MPSDDLAEAWHHDYRDLLARVNAGTRDYARRMIVPPALAAYRERVEQERARHAAGVAFVADVVAANADRLGLAP